MNKLTSQKSAYLQHASLQKIDWYPWSEEPFEKAREENKPVFLSSGAIWCHWCHVMAKESFEDDEVAGLLNDHFIAVKLDRDERPDIDRRYQQAVAGMGFSGGWPLSVFLTADKQPFYGGTYFPTEERFGRAGFKDVLRMVAEIYRTKRDEIDAYSHKLTAFFKDRMSVPGDISEESLARAIHTIRTQIDHHNGGFGEAPKFAMSGAIEFMLNRYFLTEDKEMGNDLLRTLTAMAKGGFHDHLGGGFHRYSTDSNWIIPHFEKMADDNAWLLRNYADAYAVFGVGYFKEVAEEIIAFMRRELADPEGGFYASQDADVTADDEGGYFTWTDDDLKRALSEEEYPVLSRYFIDKRGSMHHDGSKHVLFAARDLDAIGAELGINRDKVEQIISRGKAKLFKERQSRERPFVDTALYTSLNGMCISAFLRAFRLFGDEGIRTFALKSLNFIFDARFLDGRLFHVEHVEGLLDDYAHLIDALITAYEVTGDPPYLGRAEELMNLCVKGFWDMGRGGFFDTETEVLGMQIKTADDSPHPSANSMAMMALVRLYAITGNQSYQNLAEGALKVFSRDAEGMGIHGGYYYCAMDAYFNSLKLEIHAPADSALARSVLATFHPYAAIVYGSGEGYVTPCFRNTCFKPLYSGDELRESLKHIIRQTTPSP